MVLFPLGVEQCDPDLRDSKQVQRAGDQDRRFRFRPSVFPARWRTSSGSPDPDFTLQDLLAG